MAGRTQTLAQLLLNQWRTSQDLARELYGEPIDDKKLRAARQALSRLREALESSEWPLEVPAGRTLVLDERWQRKSDGRGSEKYFRLRYQEARPEPSAGGASYLQLWFPPSSWSGWIVPGFQTLERDRSISHKHLYTGSRGPDNWLTVASSPIYREAERKAGEAMYEEMNAAEEPWLTSSVVYVGLGTGSGLADVQVLRELLEGDRGRAVQAVPLDFSPVLLSETVANIYQELGPEIEAGRLGVLPILGDLEQPEDWARLLPPIQTGASLVVGMFGNTIGHLQNRERSTIQRIFTELDRWARRHGAPRWTVANSRMLLGVSLQRKDGWPHGRTVESCRRWLNLVGDPLRTLLETVEGEYQTVCLPPEEQQRVEGAVAIAELRRRRAGGGNPPLLGRFYHEELPYRPSDGITGVVQRYSFAFERDLDLEGEKVFHRHHLPESRWRTLGELRASFTAGEDQVVLCEVTQFNLKTFRPALRRLGMVHSDRQVYVAKVANMKPYAVLGFAPVADRR
ncbi:MAG: hypothetical protein D6702_02560 [Planctomycetota bacterium]|nr:MAG: hypothetical protein D6702_02560 [Planctomycetota bacterium]